MWQVDVVRGANGGDEVERSTVADADDQWDLRVVMAELECCQVEFQSQLQLVERVKHEITQHETCTRTW